MQQHTGARQMAQELVAQPRTFRRALDQAGNVGDDETFFVRHAHHTQVGMQGREGIIRHLGFGCGDRAYESRFARVRHTQQAHISQHFQLQLQFAGLAFGPCRALARRAIGAGFEVDVAQAADSALREQRFFAVDHQVGHDFAAVQIGDDRPYRHAQYDIVRPLAVAVGAAPRLSVLGAVVLLEAKVYQGVDVAVRHRPDAAAASAVTAIGAALVDIFFTAKTGDAIAALAREDFYF